MEMSTDRVSRRSFPSVLVPTLFGQFPSASTKANVPRPLWLAWPLALYNTRYDFRLPMSHRFEREAASKHFIDNHSEGIDICLLGNPSIIEVEHLGVEQLGGHVRHCTHELIYTRRYGEGRRGYEGRETEVADTGLGNVSVLNEDVTLIRGIALAKSVLARANRAADVGNVLTPFTSPWTIPRS